MEPRSGERPDPASPVGHRTLYPCVAEKCSGSVNRCINGSPRGGHDASGIRENPDHN